MLCTNCGKEIDDGSVFCSYCGSKQEQKSSEISAKESNVSQHTSLNDPTPEPMTSVQDLQVEKSGSTGIQNQANTTTPGKSKPFGVVAIIGALVVLAAILLFSGKGSGYKDWKGLINDYYRAIEKENFKALLKCYDKDDQKDLKEDKKDIKEILEELSEDYKDEYGKGWIKKLDMKRRRVGSNDDDADYYRITVTIDDDGTEYLVIKKYKNRYYMESKF